MPGLLRHENLQKSVGSVCDAGTVNTVATSRREVSIFKETICSAQQKAGSTRKITAGVAIGSHRYNEWVSPNGEQYNVRRPKAL